VLDNVNRILAASTGSLLYGPGVFRSDIMGNNFEAIYSDNEVNAVAVDQYGGIYIGLESDLSIDWGVMYSSDDGVTWEDNSSGIEECSYFNQIFISSNNYVFAITEIPFKLYRSLNPIVTMEESTALDIFDVCIQPNPFRNKTVIRFQSYVCNKIIIHVFNSLGKTIIYSRKELITSNSETILDLSNYSSGIYFVCINVDNFCIIKKIIKH
jgi:hypothetical protein